MNFDYLPILESEFDVQGFPSARLNRSEKWIKPYPHEQAMVYPGQETDNSIKINSKLHGDNLTIDIDLIFENGSEAGDKLVVYLTENGILHDQINYNIKNQNIPNIELVIQFQNFKNNNEFSEP